MSMLRILATLSVICLGVPAASPAAAESYKIDGGHSMVIFKVNHLGVGNAYGRFNEISGTFSFDEANPAGSSFEVTIKADSVDTFNDKRDQHLRSPDFFNAKQFPVITLKSQKVKKTGDGQYEVTGELSLHGKTRPITFPVHQIGAGDDPWGNYRRGFEAELKVKRADFGMNYMPEGLGAEVTVTVAVEGIRN